MDVTEAEAAGIRDAARRRPLLEYLESLGYTVDDMAAAEAQGRLFALGGDAVIRSGRPLHSLRSAAEQLALPLTDVAHAWAALGLTVADAEQIALSEADLAGLRTWAEMRRVLGADMALGLLRVIGASMARLAEAESSAIRSATPTVWLEHTGDELRTAQAFTALAGVVPRLGELIDAVHRQHIVSARTYFEAIAHVDSEQVECGVGFADLSGFTSLSQRLSMSELSGLLSVFGATAADVVHQHGGRLVKLLGDAVMWVSADARALVEVADHLVHHPYAAKAGVQMRAGLAFGSILSLDGDYFGPAVNLAARLVGTAEPGQVLASEHIWAELTGWDARVMEPVTLRGFDNPVVPYELRRAS